MHASFFINASILSLSSWHVLFHIHYDFMDTILCRDSHISDVAGEYFLR